MITTLEVLRVGCRAECYGGLFSNPVTYRPVKRDSYGLAAITDHDVGALTAEHGGRTIGGNGHHGSKARLRKLVIVAPARTSLC